jgi:hypothetical protein
MTSIIVHRTLGLYGLVNSLRKTLYTKSLHIMIYKFMDSQKNESISNHNEYPGAIFRYIIIFSLNIRIMLLLGYSECCCHINPWT